MGVGFRDAFKMCANLNGFKTWALPQGNDIFIHEKSCIIVHFNYSQLAQERKVSYLM